MKDFILAGGAGISLYTLTMVTSKSFLPSVFPEEVKKGIAEKHNVIMTLTHPRNWKVDFLANTLDNVERFWQGWKYRN